MINNDPEVIEQLTLRQHYELCYWQETDKTINYRRFFTVNALICLNIQDQAVFNTFHQVVKNLLDEDIIQGLRIDHIDGLYNPAEYLARLRVLTGPETYTVVEKILESGEELPHQWPVQGTTGYEFLAAVNNLFTQEASKQDFTRFYYTLAKYHATVPQQIRDKKSAILYAHMLVNWIICTNCWWTFP